MTIITADEARKFFATIPPRSPFGTRDRAILVFLLHTGLRVGELCALDVGKVWGHKQPRQLIRVRGKGGKVRLIPLNDTAQKAVWALVTFNRSRGFSTDPTAPLLVNRKHKRLSTRAVQYMFEKWREKADLATQATPHGARHGFATALLEKSVPTRQAQELLGHRRLASTQRYTHPTLAALTAGVKKLD